MNLGGLQKNSLIDYPGKVSCVIFMAGCNFNCPYCHNPSLVKGETEGPFSLKEDLHEFLDNRKSFLDAVVISGGEPTLQKNLLRLCESIKRLGYSIKLDTNGSRPRELERLIKGGLVDYIAMDIKTDPADYHRLVRHGCNPEDILSSIVSIMESAPAYEFRTTCVKGFVDERIIKKIAELIKGADLYALQQFRKTELLWPGFFQGRETGYSEEDLLNLKAIAEQWVKRCIVR